MVSSSLVNFIRLMNQIIENYDGGYFQTIIKKDTIYLSPPQMVRANNLIYRIIIYHSAKTEDVSIIRLAKYCGLKVTHINNYAEITEKEDDVYEDFIGV